MSEDDYTPNKGTWGSCNVHHGDKSVNSKWAYGQYMFLPLVLK